MFKLKINRGSGVVQWSAQKIAIPRVGGLNLAVAKSYQTTALPPSHHGWMTMSLINEVINKRGKNKSFGQKNPQKKSFKHVDSNSFFSQKSLRVGGCADGGWVDQTASKVLHSTDYRLTKSGCGIIIFGMAALAASPLQRC